ncbi:MAG: hypothetical protein IIX94_00925 [Clostridia bacterium]|nr:hypothetical protein [Clostridia bacterium]
MKLHLWLYRLENKISKIAIEKLMSLLTVAMVIVWAVDLLMPITGYEVSIYGMLSFDRARIFSGEVWRIITFLFLYPAATNHLFTALALYFYWWLGSSLEAYMGKARFNLFYIFGVIGSIIAGLIVGGMDNFFLNISLFLGFAVLFPETKVLLFFFIPVKIKWLGMLDGFILLVYLILGTWVDRAAILAAIASFLLFFGPRLWYDTKRWYREYKYRKNYYR